MSNKKEAQTNEKAIDRLTGQPYSDREGSDAGVTGDLISKPWTLDEVRRRAETLGKSFNPNRKNADRLESDLAENGVIVLFTEADVKAAVELGAVAEDEEENLIELVSPEGYNDIVLLPAVSPEQDQNQRLIDWFLTNNRC